MGEGPLPRQRGSLSSLTNDVHLDDILTDQVGHRAHEFSRIRLNGHSGTLWRNRRKDKANIVTFRVLLHGFGEERAIV